MQFPDLMTLKWPFGKYEGQPLLMVPIDYLDSQSNRLDAGWLKRRVIDYLDAPVFDFLQLVGNTHVSGFDVGLVFYQRLINAYGSGIAELRKEVSTWSAYGMTAAWQMLDILHNDLVEKSVPMTDPKSVKLDCLIEARLMLKAEKNGVHSR